MLCTVALRRMQAQDKGPLYSLRITGKTVLGPAGTGGQDTKDSLSADDVRAALQRLRLSEDALATANTIMNDAGYGHLFTVIAEDVQIPFEVLERLDVSLFD